ncbi:vWA domain-containing protein [Ruania alba]|uniref:Ca-activated chloride channel family protein n=1 Tax=Ruania alba TaxID=648782 RepID=A0A1H5KWF5_9MICO|nr:VWA domain-containing protein [Ruania alba]SEE69156.1 Ca-activated chloride channel family protein [Ruania alba]
MVSSVLLHPWALWVVLGVVLVALVLGWFARAAKQEKRQVTWVANAGYLPDLPSFKSRLSRYRVFLLCLAVVLFGSSIATGFLVARPVDREVRSEELATRDIVLCLDVSGSMIEYDTEIVQRFLELLPSFHGERIALSIYNSTSRTVFPLTDDYTLVEEQLTEAAEALDFDVDSLDDYSYDAAALDRLLQFLAGTEGLGQDASSLVGDGLATCALAFDLEDEERSRSIIMATDNEVFGEPLYTLPEAADLVAERDITLHGFYAGAVTPDSAAQQKEYQDAVEAHGGLFYASDDPDAVSGIVDEISAQQAAELDADADVIITDRPEKYFAALMGLIGLYLLAVWRLRA